MVILKIGDPVLRRRCAPAKRSHLRGSRFAGLLKKMIRSMRGADGVGLAANQVGHNTRVFIIECRVNKRYPGRGEFPLEIYVNPRVLSVSKRKVSDWEGCLSIPGYRGWVPRHESVTFEALTREGELVKKTFRGFKARVIQHELDHLNGIFYVDRMRGFERWMHLDEFNKRRVKMSMKKVRGEG